MSWSDKLSMAHLIIAITIVVLVSLVAMVGLVNLGRYLWERIQRRRVKGRLRRFYDKRDREVSGL